MDRLYNKLSNYTKLKLNSLIVMFFYPRGTKQLVIKYLRKQYGPQYETRSCCIAMQYMSPLSD